ncbi:MAG: glycosyltransferase family 2 protein [Chloroflexota bacterium]
MDQPLISIITPCFNRVTMVSDAVESVLAQDDPHVEHIVVDGVSTDGTLDVLKRYPYLKILSEPDQGMYDAINKGINLARGDIIGFLNTDDLYSPGCFHAVRAVFSAYPEIAAVVGEARLFNLDDPSGHSTLTYPAIGEDKFWYRLLKGAPIFNAWFFQRRALEQIGSFDTSYRIAADREYLIRAGLCGIRPSPIHQPMVDYRQHQDSLTFSTLDSRSSYGMMRIRNLLESIRVLESYHCHPLLTIAANRILISAHSELSYQLFATSLYHHQWQQAVKSFFRGWRYSPLFLMALIRGASQRLYRELTTPKREHGA